MGDRARLEPIWSAYFVAPFPDEGGSAEATPAAVSGGVDALHRRVAREYLVVHSAPVYLIDREGRLRVVHTLPIDPIDLVHDLRLLLG